jgi:hypothetical protein
LQLLLTFKALIALVADLAFIAIVEKLEGVEGNEGYSISYLIKAVLTIDFSGLQGLLRWFNQDLPEVGERAEEKYL